MGRAAGPRPGRGRRPGGGREPRRPAPDGGGPRSLAALDLANAIAAAAGSRVWARVLAARRSGIDDAVLQRLAQPLRVEYRELRPVEAPVTAAAEADLVILGARGLSGSRALGNVSERVAHRAGSAVLIGRSRD